VEKLMDWSDLADDIVVAEKKAGIVVGAGELIDSSSEYVR
jgi:hypothetical protein